MADRLTAGRLCSRCESDNRCAVAAGLDLSLCWCRNVDLGKARLPADSSRCLCQACACALDEAGRNEAGEAARHAR